MFLALTVATAHALTCEGYQPAVEIGSVAGSPIVEASGLAFARARPDVWFTHNDAGGVAAIYAFSIHGTFVETHEVDGAGFVDWEDMAAGPCPDDGGDCLFLGDIGDNGRVRGSIAVYAVREPAAGARAPVIATWNAVYPTGPKDSEALFVHPRTGRIYLATKDPEGTVSAIWRFPEAPGEDARELEWVYDWTPTPGSAATTGADWDPDGERLVIRTYSAAYEWATDPCDPEGHWGSAPVAWDIGDARGEAIAYDTTGDLIVVSEGDPMVLRRMACTSVGGAGGPCDSGDADTDTDTDTDTDSDADGDSDPATDTDETAGPEDSGPRRDGGCGACGGCAAGGPAGVVTVLLAFVGVSRRRSTREVTG